MTSEVRIGLVGCGNISQQYLTTLTGMSNLKLQAVADLNPVAAERVASAHQVPALSVEDLTKSPDIDIVLNLTPPQAHAPVTIAALKAGKHVYQEKPFSASLAEAQTMLSTAAAAGQRIGSAPDTVLGVGIQTARQLIDSGQIGTPIAATAFMMCPGHESWHPNPAFFYREGGGPLLDMGPYYLTALVTMLGPIASVAAMGTRSTPERVVPDGAPQAGERLPVEVDTYLTANLRHVSGPISTLIVTFDAAASQLPEIEVYGTEATMAVPDPNWFTNPVKIARRGQPDFAEVPVSAGYAAAGRGFGLADMARAIALNEPHRQSAALGFHVNEVMWRILESVETSSEVRVRSTCGRPAAVPLGVEPADA